MTVYQKLLHNPYGRTDDSRKVWMVWSDIPASCSCGREYAANPTVFYFPDGYSHVTKSTVCSRCGLLVSLPIRLAFDSEELEEDVDAVSREEWSNLKAAGRVCAICDYDGWPPRLPTRRRLEGLILRLPTGGEIARQDPQDSDWVCTRPGKTWVKRHSGGWHLCLVGRTEADRAKADYGIRPVRVGQYIYAIYMRESQ